MVHRLPAAHKVNARRSVVRGERECSSCHVEAVGCVVGVLRESATVSIELEMLVTLPQQLQALTAAWGHGHPSTCQTVRTANTDHTYNRQPRPNPHPHTLLLTAILSFVFATSCKKSNLNPLLLFAPTRNRHHTHTIPLHSHLTAHDG